MQKRFSLPRCLAAALSAMLTLTAVPCIQTAPEVSAAGVEYAPQLMHIAAYDDSANLSAADTKDASPLALTAENGTLGEQWRIDYCGADGNGSYFKIVNAASGRLLTPMQYGLSSGTEAVIYGNENDHAQYWYIVPTDKDSLGNDLHYKIVNYADTDLALTSGKTGLTVADYAGEKGQQWLLDPAGLQGFAGYCFDDTTGKVKAADIGGLLGETVEVSNFADLQKYATADEPYTIVVTDNISVTELNLNGTRYMCSAGRIYVHSNKTIIGSYDKHTLFNVQFCTASKSGTGNNIILKNFESTHDRDSNNNDSIQFYFGSGENIWVDHVTFVGHDGYGEASNGEVDEDKFLACCYDADYCTVSDCSFGAHKYGLILGYPADGADLEAQYDNYPRMSLIANSFHDTHTRGPGLMRWGYYHSLNNYVNTFSMAYTVITKGKIFAENCVYENGGNVICDWDKMTFNGYYSETGSIFQNCQRTKQGGDSNSTAQPCTWRPASNYQYKALTAEQAKTYTTAYSGAQKTAGNVNYSTYAAAGVPSPGFMAGVEDGWGSTAPAELPTNAYFMIRNANSGLYLDIAGGEAANGTNVQQWGASEAGTQDTFRFVPAGEGYYYIQSMVGDKTYVIDVTGGKTENGTNIELYAYKGNDNQKFLLTANADGSYQIHPKKDTAAFVEIASASEEAGANCALWEKTGSACQNWFLEEVTFAGETMDTALSYHFINADLGADLAGQGDWTIKSATGDLYYLISGGQYLTVQDGKAVLAAADTTTNVQMMRFVKDPDGTYMIVPRAGYDKTAGRYTQAVGASSVEVISGAAGQRWLVETEPLVLPTESVPPTEPFPPTDPVKPTEPDTPPVLGDVNADGACTLADIVVLQKWLLGSGTLTAWQNVDIDRNGMIDVFDLGLLKNFVSGISKG